MEAAIVIGIMVAVVLLVLAIALIVQHFERKRSERIQVIAESLGLSFAPAGDASLDHRRYSFPIFKVGRDRKVLNLISGETDEVRISIFDYQYTTGSGKSQQTVKWTLTCLESPRLNNPEFSLRPEHFFDKIGSLIGLQDIDFPDHPQFSQAFVLKGPDEEAVRKFFRQPLLDFFVQRPGIVVEAQSGAMVCHNSRRAKPEEIKLRLAEAYEIFGIIADSARS